MKKILEYLYGGEILYYPRPTQCPICGAGIAVGPSAVGHFDDEKGNIALLYAVTECHACCAPFLSYFIPGKTPNSFVLGIHHPHNYHTPKTFSKYIQETFPDFVNFYHQSETAEHENLKDICGVGYRKSLEFLIKTYLIKIVGINQKTVEDTALGKCYEYIDNDLLGKCMRKSTQLGNDQVHYKKLYKDSDIVTLKECIDILVLWIDFEHTAKSELEKIQL